MPQTRTNARLAKVAEAEAPEPKSPLASSSKAESPASNANQTEAQDLECGIAQKENEHHNFEKESLYPPKRKRTRTNHLTKNSAASRQSCVPGEPGCHADLMNLPIDLFTEIALYLVPKDIISLSRISKPFRSLLMSRSARHIWLGAMRNVPGLPPCPADMVEPHYLAMIYGDNCMMCGEATTRRMDEVLRTRLCIPCANEAVFDILAVPTEAAGLVSFSRTILPGGDYVFRNWAFRSHVAYVQIKLEELKDLQARQAWKQERQKLLDEQDKQASALRKFVDQIGRKCRRNIETRLLKEAWDWADLDFRDLKEEWIGLVERPEPLTDQIWVNLKPKLIPLLEANRVEHLEREHERIQANRDDLEERMQDLNFKTKPIVQATIYRPATTFGSPLDPATERLRFTGIFPDMIDVLEWDETKELFEIDLAYNNYPIAGIRLAMAPINECVSDWISDTEAMLVDMMRKGRVDDGLSSDIPGPALPLAEQPDDWEDSEESDDEELPHGPFKHASENQKVLLRADSLFRSVRNGAPVTYEDLVQTGYATITRKLRLGFMESYRTVPLDTSKFQRHAAGQAQARRILEWMGKPDATFLEMRSVGSAYTCARCPEGYVHSWEGIVDHFVSQANNWKRIENGREELAKRDVTFRDVHDPAWERGKPLVRILSKAEKAQTKNFGGELEECCLCLQVEPEITTLGLQHRMREHLEDMHNISEPKYRVHYGPWAN